MGMPVVRITHVGVLMTQRFMTMLMGVPVRHGRWILRPMAVIVMIIAMGWIMAMAMVMAEGKVVMQVAVAFAQ